MLPPKPQLTIKNVSPDAFTADRNNNILPSISAAKAVYEITIVPDSLVLAQGANNALYN